MGLFQKMLKAFCVIITLCIAPFLHADGLGPTIEIPNGGVPPNTAIFSSYNSQSNQFMAIWSASDEKIRFIISNVDGTLLAGPTQTVVFPYAPVSDIILSYNRINNQYFFTYDGYGGSHYYNVFTILNADGSLLSGPTAIANPSNIATQSGTNISNCYNSTANQYFIVWRALDTISMNFGNYFAILNADGSVAIPAANIPNALGITTAANVYSSCNTLTSQYFVTWFASDFGSYFAIYNANGTAAVPATSIPNAPGIITFGNVYNCYNNQTNQYLITWKGNDGNPYFAIYNAAGAAVKGATKINNLLGLSTTSDVFSSYNSRNNQFLITWEALDNQSYFAIYSAEGVQIQGATVIPNLTGFSGITNVCSSFSSTSDKFFISWAAQNGSVVNPFIAIYSSTPPPPPPPPLLPPSNLRGSHTFNRFANYGEYFNQLIWNPSSTARVVSYNIYRLGKLIANVPYTQTSYQEHNQPNAPITYSLTAVDGNGNESARVSITL